MVARGGEDLLGFLRFARDRHDDDLRGRDRGWKPQALVVAMHHDDGAEQPRRNAPARLPCVLKLIALIEEANLERLGEILSEEVRGPALQRASIGHQPLDGVGLIGAGKSFGRALAPDDQRNREEVLYKLSVNLQHR